MNTRRAGSNSRADNPASPFFPRVALAFAASCHRGRCPSATRHFHSLESRVQIPSGLQSCTATLFLSVLVSFFSTVRVISYFLFGWGETFHSHEVYSPWRP